MAALTQRATSMEARRLAYAGLSLSTFGWAAAFIAGKVALADMTPLSVAVWRYALASTVLLPFALRQRPASGIGRAAAPLAVMVVCGGVLYPWFFNLASRPVVARLARAFTNCVVYGLGGLALYALARADAPWAQLAAATPAARGGIVLMALLSSVMAGQLFLVGVRTVGVGRTVVFVYLVPVLTAVLSATILGEPFRVAQVVGGSAVLGGVYWTTRG